MNLQNIPLLLDQNKEWIFSGIGVVMLGFIVKVLFVKKKEATNGDTRHEVITGNHNIRAGNDVKIENLVIGGNLQGSHRDQDVIPYPDSEIQHGCLRIDSPQNGGIIELMRGEGVPVIRFVEGHVDGYSESTISENKLRVKVSILTDKWYPQGITKVDPDGKWEIQVHYGGLNHTIEAILTDKDNRKIDECTCLVTLHQ